jgi:hypothetical protein
MTPGGLEQWIAERMLRHIEPRLERWIDEFLRSDDGQALMADVLADVVADVIHPAADGHDLTERVVLRLATALAASRPAFRLQLKAALGPD